MGKKNVYTADILNCMRSALQIYHNLYCGVVCLFCKVYVVRVGYRVGVRRLPAQAGLRCLGGSVACARPARLRLSLLTSVRVVSPMTQREPWPLPPPTPPLHPPTGIATTRAVYSGNSVSLPVSHLKCLSLCRYSSVNPSFLSPTSLS